MRPSRESLNSPLVGIAAGALAVTVVTAAIAVLDNFIPVLSLGVLYVFAVLPIALVWGTAYAVLVAVASMLAFNFFFLPPVYTFTLADRSNWFALLVYVVTAVVVGSLASHARGRRADAEQRELESSLLADIAVELLRGTRLEDELDRIEERAATVLGVSSVRIDLGGAVSERTGEAPHPLSVDGRDIGTLYTPEREEAPLPVQRRLLPALASLLAVTQERERLSGKALEAEALRRSDTIKTAVIQAVSHDLRTPLATIEQALGGLQSGELVLSDADRAGLLETISAEHSRLKRLVENLLDISRLQAGAAESSPQLWTADELLAQAVGELGESERVIVSTRPELPPVTVDAVQVQRALVNVLENALRLSPPGEPVHVRVSATRKELLIRVTDRGPGIVEEEYEQIFEPFYRVAGQPDQRGAGLGLAIARGFTEANGGRLWVESHAGQGASFVLALPAVELPAAVSSARSPARGAVSGERILVVDDEPQFLRALQTNLRGAGYDVATATTAEEALAAAGLRPPEAVILDLLLPDGRGTDVCRELRRWTEAPIILVSAVGEEAEKIAALDAGADDYVTKPFAIGELLARLRAVLRRVGPATEPVLEIGELVVDLEKRSVGMRGVPVHLTPHEFGLLRVLAQHEGKLLTHKTLLHEVWGPAYQRESSYLHVFVSQLRRKLEADPARPQYILTEPGVGYRLVNPVLENP